MCVEGGSSSHSTQCCSTRGQVADTCKHVIIQVLCRKEYTAEEAAQFEEFIRDEYTAHLVLDNLPAAVRLYNEDDPNEVWQGGVYSS